MTTSPRSNYDFLCPPRLVFGWGRRREVGALGRSLGRRAFVIHGARRLERSGVLGRIMDDLKGEGVEAIDAGGLHHEPRVEDVDAAARNIRRAGPGPGDFVLGIGGGAALDLAKAAAAMAVQVESPTVKDYLEGVGRGLQLCADPLPFLAVPTTAGTGSEATKNAVVSHSGSGPAFKKSLRSDRMLARAAVVDPELTVSVPPETTAATGMDAITQLVESYISLKAKPIPSALAIRGLAAAGDWLLRAYRDGADREARERMAHAALLSGMALANSGLGLAHGVAAALGIHAGVPHGLACAVMLPVALRVNREAREREIAAVGEALCGRRFDAPAEGAAAAIEKVEELCSQLRIPRTLGALGVRPDQVPLLVESAHGSSFSGNPRQVSDSELRSILESLL